MNIDNIKIFVAAYQKRSFAAVAKALDLAPSSISRSIASLEAEVNVRLFQRSTRKLTPTQAGELYYRRILPLIEELDSVQQELVAESSGPSGNLKITASVSYGQLVLAPLLTEFYQLYPNISIELVLSDNRVDLITEQIDLAIRHGTLPDSNFISRKLAKVKYSLVTSPDFLTSISEILQPEDILQQPLVSFNYQGFSKNWHFKKDNQIKVLNIQPNLIVNNAATIQECIKNNFGIAMLADWTIARDIRIGELVRVLPDWSISGDDKQANIWLVQPSRNFVPEKVKVFKEFLLIHC